MKKNNALTGFGLDSRRKVFKSPPARSSNTMKRGCLSKQTPMKWTMLGWLNFDMISASIRKSISAWFELSSGNVFTATAISDESLFRFFLKYPWYTSPNAPCPSALCKMKVEIYLSYSFENIIKIFSYVYILNFTVTYLTSLKFSLGISFRSWIVHVPPPNS